MGPFNQAASKLLSLQIHRILPYSDTTVCLRLHIAVLQSSSLYGFIDKDAAFIFDNIGIV